MFNLRQFNALAGPLLLILTVMLSAWILVPKSRAAEQVVLSVYPNIQTAGIGQIFNVSIMISIPSSLPVMGVQFTLTWNSTYVTGENMTDVMFHNVTPETDWDNIAKYLNSVTNEGQDGLGSAEYCYTYYDVLLAMDSGYAPITGDYELATITFEGASTGYSSLQFTYVLVGDKDGNDLPSSGVDGSVIVGNPVPVVAVLSPLNDSYNPVPMNLTVAVSKQAAWIGYSIDDQANLTLATDVASASSMIQVPEGQHYLVAYANDSSGQMAPSNKTYFTTISTPPTASLAISPQTSGDAAEFVLGAYRWEYNFSASESKAKFSNISSYFWDFGDGTNATGVAVTHNYTQPGTYNVTLTVTDLAGNSATESSTINISPVSSPVSLEFVVTIIIPVVWVPALVFYMLRTRRKSKEIRAAGRPL